MRAKNKAEYGTREKTTRTWKTKGKAKAKQSKSTIHFIKSPEIVFELISSSQRMFKRFFNENYLNYSAPTSFMSFPFYANICCAMRWNVGAACFFHVQTKPNQEEKKENQRENELGSTKRDPQNTNTTQIRIHMYGPYARAHKTRIWLKGLHGDNDNDNDIVDTKQQAAT